MSEYTSGLKITFSYYHDVFPPILSCEKLINLNLKVHEYEFVVRKKVVSSLYCIFHGISAYIYRHELMH